MIPEEAVEAAAKYLAVCTGSPGADWTVEARAILEVAAPHIAAAVLNEAADRADEQGITSITPGALRRRAKSYRPTP